MPIDDGSPEWPHQQVAAEIRRRIKAGTIGPRLPGVHALADELHVSHMTVQKALGVLKDEGLIYAAPGRGTFVKK